MTALISILCFTTMIFLPSTGLGSSLPQKLLKEKIATQISVNQTNFQRKKFPLSNETTYIYANDLLLKSFSSKGEILDSKVFKGSFDGQCTEKQVIKQRQQDQLTQECIDKGECSASELNYDFSCLGLSTRFEKTIFLDKKILLLNQEYRGPHDNGKEYRYFFGIFACNKWVFSQKIYHDFAPNIGVDSIFSYEKNDKWQKFNVVTEQYTTRFLWDKSKCNWMITYRESDQKLRQ